MPTSDLNESTLKPGRRSPMMMMAPRLSRFVVLGICAWLGFSAALMPATARADARVDVEVKDTSGRFATAQVTLILGSVTKTCATVGGRCSITVPAGRYQVRLVPSGGATTTSQVTVPASGAIRLALLVAPATTTPPANGAGSTTSTTKPAATTTQTQGVTPTGSTTLRDLSRGGRLLVQGSITDRSGRLTNATIIVQLNGRAVGRAGCVGGRFTLYDLAAGRYTLLATAPNGTRATVTLDVKTSLLRPTLRLAP